MKVFNLATFDSPNDALIRIFDVGNYKSKKAFFIFIFFSEFLIIFLNILDVLFEFTATVTLTMNGFILF
jgi:hypothetical protein